MAALPRKRRLGSKARRALELLSSIPFGAAEPTLLTLGFSRGILLGLVNQGLATLTYEKVRAAGKNIEVGSVRITDAGRDALAADG